MPSSNDDISYYHGVATKPLIGKTLHSYLEDVAKDNLDGEAVVSLEEGRRLTYRELFSESDRLAKQLIASGIKRGDRVGIWSTNNSRWFEILLAVSKIGAILVNINPSYRVMELEYALNQSEVKLLFTLTKNRSIDYKGMLEELSPHLFDTKLEAGESTCPHIETLVFIDDFEGESSRRLYLFDEFNCREEKVDESELSRIRSIVQIDDPVNIQYTSGTTGHPKGVTLSHHNLVNNAYFSASAMQVESSSRFCVPMPFYHCGGLISSALTALVAGGCVVIPSPFFEAEPTLEALQNEKCTHVSGVPTMFIAQLEHPDFESYNLSTLKSGFMAGAPCPVELMKKVAASMNVKDIVILYGLTESSPLMTATTVNDSLKIRSETVGRAIDGVEIKIIDTESGEIVKRGEQGEICCRGHLVMLGYWNNKKATEETIDKARWLHSGDLGTMSAEGYLNITGRIKDMIVRGGENVYPREIEEILHHHDEVSQAQVFGVPDQKLGEEIALWLILKPGSKLETSDIREWMQEKISHYKIPRYIKIVSEFPMTVTGKIRKFKMKESMVEELSLQVEANIQTA